MENVEKAQQQAFCRKCRQETNHQILNKTEKSSYWDEIDEGETYTYYTLQCKGCETICLLEKYNHSEDRDFNTGEYFYTYTFYPSAIGQRIGLEETYLLPVKLRKIYIECLKALNSNLPILTSIGLRVIIEGICLDKNLKTGSLEKKIDNLVIAGFMTKNEGDFLHLNRNMGNASAHELVQPLEEELKTGFDIIETILRNAYILPHNASKLEKYNKLHRKIVNPVKITDVVK